MFQMKLQRTDIFMMLNLSTQGHSLTFYSFKTYLCKNFLHVEFISQDFNSLAAISSGIFSSIFYNLLLGVLMKATDFYILFLYLVITQNSPLAYNDVQLILFVSPSMQSYTLKIVLILPFFFQFECPWFLSFSHLCSNAKQQGGRWICLALVLGTKICISPSSMMFVWGGGVFIT